MASIIRIKRSGVAGNPAVLAAGELAYSALADNGSNGGDRLYIGFGTETAGNAANHIVIGGKYFTDMLSHTRGTLTASAAIVTDANSKIDNLKVDNLDLNGNTISSTDTNGDINLTPNGTGSIVLDGQKWPQADGSANFYLKTDGAGQLAWAAIPSGTFTIAGDTGTDSFATGQTLTFTGTNPIDTTVTDNTVTISVRDATTAAKGVASFADANFTVTSGAVSTKSITLGTSTLTNGSTTLTLAGLQQLDVDNIRIDGNEISSTNTDGNISLNPNGSGNIDVNNAKIINLATPTQATDAATKGYVDATKSGLDLKESVRVATTANLTATAAGSGATRTLTNSGTQAALSIDSINLVQGDRVLVKNQTAGEDNGIYVVTDVGSVSTNWVLTRASDASTNAQVNPGLFVFVEQGTTNGDNGYVLTTDGPITLDTTPLTFTQFSGAGQLVAGAGLTKTGNTIDVVAGDGIVVNADNVTLASTVAGNGLTFAAGVISVGGTADRISVTSDAIDIASTYVGQASITTLGTITTGTWNATTIATTYGGTGLTSYTTGDIIYASATNTLARLAAGTEGKVLQINASGVPVWGDVDGGTY